MSASSSVTLFGTLSAAEALGEMLAEVHHPMMHPVRLRGTQSLAIARTVKPLSVARSKGAPAVIVSAHGLHKEPKC